MKNLEPCSFCGCDSLEILALEGADTHQVRCECCGARGPIETLSGCVLRWNDPTKWADVRSIRDQAYVYGGAAKIPVTEDMLSADQPLLGPPNAICSFCGRKTWSKCRITTDCGMTQPDGSTCPGLLMPYPLPRWGKLSAADGHTWRCPECGILCVHDKPPTQCPACGYIEVLVTKRPEQEKAEKLAAHARKPLTGKPSGRFNEKQRGQKEDDQT